MHARDFVRRRFGRFLSNCVGTFHLEANDFLGAVVAKLCPKRYGLHTLPNGLWDSSPLVVKEVNLQFEQCSYVPAAHLQESRSPPGRKPQNSLKRVFLGLRPRVSKKFRKGRRVPEKSPEVSWRGLVDLFGTFLRLWAGGPRKTFLRLFRGFRPGGLRDSCRWAAGTRRWSETFEYLLRWEAILILG